MKRPPLDDLVVDTLTFDKANQDVLLSRLAANILGLAAGDSFRIPSDGQLQFGTLISATAQRNAAATISEARVEFSLEFGGANPRTILAELYPDGTVRTSYALATIIAADQTHAHWHGLSVMARSFTTTPDVVGLWAVGEVFVNNGRAWGGNIIASSQLGIITPKLVGLEIDVAPAPGTTPSGASGGLFINGFNSSIPGPAIHIGGVAGGLWLNGIIIEHLASAGSALCFGSAIGTVASGLDFSRGLFNLAAIFTGGPDLTAPRNQWRIGIVGEANPRFVWSLWSSGDLILFAGPGGAVAMTEAFRILTTADLRMAADKKLTFQPSAAAIDCLLPAVDARGQIGNATYRFSLVRAVTITPGDLVFENGWKMTEAEKLGLGEGIALVKPNGEVAQVWK